MLQEEADEEEDVDEETYTVVAEVGVQKLGISIENFDNPPVMVTKIVAGGWGASKGVEVNDCVVSMDKKPIEQISRKQCAELCQKRPLVLVFSRQYIHEDEITRKEKEALEKKQREDSAKKGADVPMRARPTAFFDANPKMKQFGVEQKKWNITTDLTMGQVLAMVPPEYKKALEKVERRGWHNTQWDRGYTLLHWAARTGSLDLCKFFIVSESADPYKEDERGLKPKDHAAKKKHQGIIDLFDTLKEVS